jgi:stage II sporulation protein AA (anti-sigma F factor antagonist)
VNSLVKVEEREGVLTAIILCEIDHHTSTIIREKIDALLFLYNPHTLVLDFKAVGFMDTSGIGLILGRLNKCRGLDILLRVVNLSPTLYKIVALCGIERQAGIEINRGVE